MMTKKTNYSLLLVSVAVLITAGYLYNDWNKYWNQPKQITTTEFIVNEGEGGYQVLKKLYQQNILQHSAYPRYWLKFFSNGATFKQGVYEFSGEMTAFEVLQKLVNGEEKSFQVTIVPGWTFSQALSFLQKQPHLSHTLDYQSLLEQLHLDESPEGWLAPDTYHFPDNYPLEDLLKQGVNNMKQYLQQSWQQRDVGLPLNTPYEMLILASIVEKETGIRSEKRQIAGVFLQRLDKHMRLQSDPTVIYGLGSEYQGNITKKHLLSDTPYNTYTRFGLPPTPIALPDKDSIMAVSHPILNGDLYFVADGSGGHSFSATLEEHNAKVRKYLLHNKNKKKR
ncbi:MAG TPA: endolytic transglycosylase MltG [Aeromonadales bacterium]|nr:endolytic transglycosylase MltG [Aeromonadales bacterium]